MFSIMEQFYALLSTNVIDSVLELLSKTYGSQYSEAIRSHVRILVW